MTNKKDELSPALPLSPKEREFCEEFFAGQHPGNATRSYMVVYPNTKYDVASVEASRLLKATRVREYLAELHQTATMLTAAKLQPWADLLPSAQAVIVATSEGRLRSRLAYEAAVYLTNRVIGTPTSVASTEVVVRDGRRIAKAVEAFRKRVAAERVGEHRE